MKKIILASKSPRRSEILRNLGVEFDIIASEIDENLDCKDPNKLVENLAYMKANAIAERLEYDCLVIGADTIVYKDEIIGKPTSEEDAFNLLKSLKNTFHEVISGVCVIDTRNNSYEIHSVKTKVYMDDYSDEKIKAYIATGESMDKAGAYGIQGKGSLLVEKIEGCYFNVVGLPSKKVSEILEKFNYKILK